MPRRVRIRELVWTDETVQKLWDKHRVEVWEVEDVVFRDESAEDHWSRSRRHGRRLFVHGRTRGGRRLLVILRPINQSKGIWRCASAWDDA